MFRLPEGLPVDAKTFKRYTMEYCLEWKRDSQGKGGVLSIQLESDAGSYCEDYFEFTQITAMLPKIRVAGADQSNRIRSLVLTTG